ncbi:MAG: hypothetical protein GX605_12270 [Chloroflexi bacterium]|nr:hypothetical protein [Chloroflexota bacterium]
MRDPLGWVAESALVKDILDAEAQRPVRGGEYAAMFPYLERHLPPLLEVAGLLRLALPPVQPAPSFRQTLREGLVTAARQRSAAPSPRPWRAWSSEHRELVIGAAAVGSAVSVAGVAALLIRAHLVHQRRNEAKAA